jgi:uncharacterized OsmC-like protein
MKIAAHIANAPASHRVTVSCDGQSQEVSIPPRSGAPGSSVNGGQMLFLALATCYCNDLYREAKMRGITLTSVEVEVTGEFGGRGDPASGIAYRARVKGDAPDEELAKLLEETDRVAEVQNTLRQGCPVRFAGAIL